MEQLKSTLPAEIRESLEFEEGQWATGSVLEDPFYSVEQGGFDSRAPGKLLKIERATDTSKYALPPVIAMSRFIFQSKTLKGISVPASAYVLWPYSPRHDTESGGYQTVAWAHGSSGAVPNSAPSHLRSVWQHYLAPFQLALQGYVVVAPDHAGLGVSRGYDGLPITHERLVSPAHANDVIYSVQAAREAFPELYRFVVVGHSQGGGAAWATAQRLAIEPLDGYLGSVALSPVTRILSQPDPFRSILTTAVTPGIVANFPDFKATDILTEEGYERLLLMHGIGAGLATAIALLLNVKSVKDDWMDNQHLREFQEMTENGGKKIIGPLLVVHGDRDPVLNCQATIEAVHKTMERFPDS